MTKPKKPSYGRWFRFYDEVLNDPKVDRLCGESYKAWVKLLCIASKNDGAIVRADVGFHLRISDEAAASLVNSFIEINLLDDLGDIVTPHEWNARQYKSDVTDPTAPARQKRYRNNKRNADRNAGVTVTATRADTEQRQRQKESDDDFEKFKKVYPKRKGGNPWGPARELFDAAVESGVEAETIIAAARAGVGFDRDKEGTEFTPQAVKWLLDRRWEDYHPPPEADGPIEIPDLAVKLFRDVGRWNFVYGPEPGKPGCRAPAEILAKYGFADRRELEVA